MYRQSITRASSGEVDNTPIIEKASWGCVVEGGAEGGAVCSGGCMAGLQRQLGAGLPPALLPVVLATPCLHPPRVPPNFLAWTLPLAQVLSLRREKAELLGFDNYAEVSMASKVGWGASRARVRASSQGASRRRR